MKINKRKGLRQRKAGIFTICCILFLIVGLITQKERKIIATSSGGYAGALALAGDTNTPTGKIGEEMKVKLHIINTNEYLDAEGVLITPKVSSDKNVFPFEISKANYSLTIDGDTNPAENGSILDAGDDALVTFTFTVRNDVPTGYYPIEFNITYRMDEMMQSVTVTSYVYIEGKEEETSSSSKQNLQISLRDSPVLPPATYGQPIYYDLYLTNYGENDAYSVTITPQVSEDPTKFPFEIEQTSYEQLLSNPLLGTKSQPDVEARKQRVHFAMTARVNLKSGYYPVVFHITALDANGETYTIDQTVYFNVAGNPKEDETETTTTTEPPTTHNTSVPRLIITGYEVDKEEIKAGDAFKLTLHIMNASNRTSVSNVKFTLSSQEGQDNVNCFIPQSGSSTVFVERIGKGQTIDLEIEMTAKPTLEAKSYPLTIESEYEDEDVKSYTGTESISIPVTQELRVSVGDIEVMPASIEVGAQSNIMFGVNNMGKSKIYNVNISFQGDSITGGEAFKGNLDSGATANVDVMVTGVAQTMDDGTVKAIISYENEKGKVFTIEKEFNLFVSEPMPIDDIPDLDPSIMDDPNMMNPTNPNMKWYIIGGIGAAVVIIAVVVIIIRKRKKRKQELEGMDDNEIL